MVADGARRAATARPLYCRSVANVYFELTEAFNAHGPTVVLASGQAVVFYRIAIMSKDGDWVLRESPEACDRVLAVLESRGARYRPSAPLDVRWLSGGWSSHFEFLDTARRRVRCDFFTRPPRVTAAAREAFFRDPARGRLAAVDVTSLILMKQTQRAKDYVVIAPLAALLPPDREIELTTDADRVLELAAHVGVRSSRPAVVAARARDRRATVVALAEEADALQQRDRARVAVYEAAAVAYLAECRRQQLHDGPLREAHARMCDAAERLLPFRPPEIIDADAE
jgi:hypothetical protein